MIKETWEGETGSTSMYLKSGFTPKFENNNGGR